MGSEMGSELGSAARLVSSTDCSARAPTQKLKTSPELRGSARPGRVAGVVLEQLIELDRLAENQAVVLPYHHSIDHALDGRKRCQ